MAGQKSSKSKKKVDDAKSDKSLSKSKQKSPSKTSKKQKQGKQGKQVKSKKQVTNKQKSKKEIDNQSSVSSILTPPAAADCIHHKSPFIYYCQTCQQLVCNQCTVYGPHNNHLHRILKITDAYRSRVFYLSQGIRSNLVDKRDKIIAQLHRLQYRIQEIKFVKGIIERDIRSQYSAILQRLKGFEGVKLANLSHEVSLVQRQIDTINDLGNQFFNLTSMDCQQTQQQKRISKFLVKSKQMYQAIQYLINKPQRQLPQLQLQQIPRQIQTNRQCLQKSLASHQLNNFKNELIWNLNVELTNQENFIQKQVDQKAEGVIKELSQEVEKSNQLLGKYRMVCAFCGVGATPEAIKNNICQANMADQVKIVVQTQKQPKQGFYHNGRHFFSHQIKKA